MNYKPKIVIGKVKNTGWPIDGHDLALALWDYDPESYHLWSWADETEDAIIQTMYQAERKAGFCLFGSFEAYKNAWETGDYEPEGVFCIPLENVDVLEIVQEEQKAGVKSAEPKPQELEEVRNHLAMVLTTNAYINICKSTDLVIAIDAIDKQIPKEVTMFDDGVYYCPACDIVLCTESGKGTGLCADKFCWQCGQAIDWGE